MGIVVAVMLGFTVADSTPAFTAVYVLWAIGWTFRTGTVDAWLYELLANHEIKDHYTRISGRVRRSWRTHGEECGWALTACRANRRDSRKLAVLVDMQRAQRRLPRRRKGFL